MGGHHVVVVLGSGGVGKSALTLKFVSGKFVDRYDPTIEDCHRKKVLVNGVSQIIEILDTAGTEQFSSLRDLYIMNGHCFLIVFSLISLQTFNDIRTIRDSILRIKCLSGKSPHQVPIVLVGNKVDLAQGGQREVSREEAENLAALWRCPYVETSARDNSGVNEAFMEAVHQLFLPRPHSRCSCRLL